VDSYRVNVSIPCLYTSTGTVIQANEKRGLWFYKFCLYTSGRIPCMTGELLVKVCMLHDKTEKHKHLEWESNSQSRCAICRKRKVRSLFSAFFIIHEVKVHVSVCSFNVQTKCTYNKRHYVHFTPTCFGITMPFSGVHTMVKTIYSKMDCICQNEV